LLDEHGKLADEHGILLDEHEKLADERIFEGVEMWKIQGQASCPQIYAQIDLNPIDRFGFVLRTQ
jgi:hypothetical protein